jgi:hypothetical protein
MIRFIATLAFTASFLIGAPAFALTSKQKKETCEFGATDQKLTGAKRKAFMAKCMSNADSPRGTPAAPMPKSQ